MSRHSARLVGGHRTRRSREAATLSECRPLVLLGLAVFVVGVDSYIVAAVLPAIADDLREPVANVGLIASAYALPVALSCRRSSARCRTGAGGRFALLLGLVIFAAAAAACIVAPNLPLLLVARAINGVGAAILLPAAFAAAGDLPDDAARGRAIALLSAAFPAVEPVRAAARRPGDEHRRLAGAVRPDRRRCRSSAIVGVATSRQRLDDRRIASRGYGATFGRVLRDRKALAIMSVTLVWFTRRGRALHLRRRVHPRSFGIPTEQAGLAYLVVGVVGIVAARSSGLVLARIGAAEDGPDRASRSSAAPRSSCRSRRPRCRWPWWRSRSGHSERGSASRASRRSSPGLSSTARGTMLAFNGSALNMGGVIGPIVTGRIIETGGFACGRAVVGVPRRLRVRHRLARPAAPRPERAPMVRCRRSAA